MTKPTVLAIVAVLIIPLNYGVWWVAADNRSVSALLVVFLALAFLQFATGVGAVVTSLMKQPRNAVAAIFGGLAALGAPFGALVGYAAMKIP